jgi:hypothetical protein
MKHQVDPALVNYMQELVSAKRPVWDGFYASGGYGMYPTTLFGFIMVLTACLYLFRPERRFVPVVITSGVLTFCSGVLGTFTGMIVVCTYVQLVEPVDAAKVMVVGSGQAFANIVFALILIILGGLATLGGVARQTFRKSP